MEYFIIQGGKKLAGETDIRGSKNAASKMMIASLLTDEQCVIENVPRSGEIDITRELCETVGSAVELDANHRMSIHTPAITTSLVPQLSRKNRIPVLALGPLLHRKGIAEIPVLGGCPIGHRPINFHLEALKHMGITIERRENSYWARADAIHGADISFPFPSVGATENILLTATLARGTTTIRNAAIEPEITNLITMLQAMGARISVNRDERLLSIEGVSKLRGTNVCVVPDRNEIVSLACAGLATKGSVFLRLPEIVRLSYAPENLKQDLDVFLKSVEQIGGLFSIERGGIRFSGTGPYRPMHITTVPHPGFMTDWQQPFCVLLTQANGTSTIHETVYEDRFRYTEDLNEMGAAITISTNCPPDAPCRYHGQEFKHLATITGPTPLAGAHITMPDIRAGMAHLVAALIAQGESIVSGVEHIDRGYEKLDERLRELGADVKRT